MVDGCAPACPATTFRNAICTDTKVLGRERYINDWLDILLRFT